MTMSARFCLSYDRINWILSFLNGYYFNRKRNVVTVVVMTCYMYAPKCYIYIFIVIALDETSILIAVQF